jgi:hypothetical protein
LYSGMWAYNTTALRLYLKMYVEGMELNNIAHRSFLVILQLISLSMSGSELSLAMLESISLVRIATV